MSRQESVTNTPVSLYDRIRNLATWFDAPCHSARHGVLGLIPSMLDGKREGWTRLTFQERVLFGVDKDLDAPPPRTLRGTVAFRSARRGEEQADLAAVVEPVGARCAAEARRRRGAEERVAWTSARFRGAAPTARATPAASGAARLTGAVGRPALTAICERQRARSPSHGILQMRWPVRPASLSRAMRVKTGRAQAASSRYRRHRRRGSRDSR